jgi:hypothetical protein
VKRKRVLAFLAALLCCIPGFGATLSTDATEAHVGVLTVGVWTPPDDGMSPPIYLLGASTIFDLSSLPDPWVFGLGVDFVGTWYVWNSTDQRAELAEPVDHESFFTLGVLLSPRFGARFALGEAVGMGAFVGLDLFIRVPLDPFASVSFVDKQLPALVYFVAGRFLYPEIGWWMTWRVTKDVELAFALRSLWPVYRAWSPEVTGISTILHQVIFAGTLGMTIRLGKPATIGKPADSAEPAAAAAQP